MEVATSFLRWIMAIELWWVSLTLFTSCFLAWFEVHGRFSNRVANIKATRLAQARTEVTKILEEARKKGLEKVEDKILSMRDHYVNVDEPERLFENSKSGFLAASSFFMFSVLIRLGLDYRLIGLEFTFWEWFIFLLGLIGLVFATNYTRLLMKL